jgi:NAD(P)-dependent dehydrogenase (short-subunit alcohol dehydrogenase family)
MPIFVRPGRCLQPCRRSPVSVAALASEAGDVDILVNNAAAFPVATTLEQTVEGFERMFDTDVRGSSS